MNIMQMQSTLENLSDRELLQAMESGSTPQYLVLAEMQKRKKTRDSAKKQKPQSGKSVADEMMTGIASVPTRPMEMAEGGIVSFAAGGKTGRKKGEEEACWTDSRTGEKYCPPNSPQVEMPRTGQRKDYAEGGPVNQPSIYGSGIMDRATRMFNDYRESTLVPDPNITIQTFADQLRSQESSEYELGTSSHPGPDPTLEPEPTPRARGTGAGRTDQYADQFFGDVSDAINADPSNMSRREQRQSASTGAGTETDSLNMSDDPRVGSPRMGRNTPAGDSQNTPEPYGQSRRGEPEEAEDDKDEFTEPQPPADDGSGSGDGGSTPQTPAMPTEPRESGLMELMRELQKEKKQTREGTKDRALNQAMIRGGLTMMGSDNPDFLGAAAEGGIQGLAGYQGTMEGAADRREQINSELTGLAAAEETSNLRRLSAQVDAMRDRRDQVFDVRSEAYDRGMDEIDLLENQLERTMDEISENPALLGEEGLQKKREEAEKLKLLIEKRKKELGMRGASGVTLPTDGPANRDTVRHEDE